MPHSKIRFAGFELYFDDLERARRFYTMKLGLGTIEQDPTHHVKLAGGDAFLCLERRGVENYPSAQKGVVFVELGSTGSRRQVRFVGDPWTRPKGGTALGSNPRSRRTYGA